MVVGPFVRRQSVHCFFHYMRKSANLYETHLSLVECSLPPGGEWRPGKTGWALAQITAGSGYWLQSQSSIELATETVFLVTGNNAGCVRSSLLNGLTLRCFSVNPARFTGLLTSGELSALKQASKQMAAIPHVLPASSPIASKMSELCHRPNRDGLLTRLSLLQLVVEILGKELVGAEQNPKKSDLTDARERLRQFLAESPPDALLEISFKDLARLTHCTARHLSRIFFDLVGMSFREKRAEIRLARARDLLANSQTKVVEVALESGYKSLSFFNLMFTRQHGISPGRWRQKNALNGGGPARDNLRSAKSR